MDFDDDAPPDLVEVTGAEEQETEVPFKVPITIVTGTVPRLVYCAAVLWCRDAESETNCG